MLIEPAAARTHGPVRRPATSGADVWWTPLGVRLTRARTAPGPWNWLFVPGHPGLGSASLVGLVDAAQVPGTSWLVDLPGDGSNVGAPGAPADPYRLWPDVIVEAVESVPNAVAVGHAAGGQHLLSVPSLETRLAGLVLIDTAPDRGWMPTFEAMRAAHPLAEAAEAAERYECQPTDANLRDLTIASASWHFTPDGLAKGRELLTRMPYNCAAAEWSEHSFDRSYLAAWWPTQTPTLIISGGEDRVVDQSLWADPYYQGPHVAHSVIERAGHFPWIERPDAIRGTFDGFEQSLPQPQFRNTKGMRS